MKIEVKHIPEPLGVQLEPYSMHIILTSRWGGRNHAVCLIGARTWTIDHLQKVLPYYDKMLREPNDRTHMHDVPQTD